MSSQFGYIPESPDQSFQNNKGIFQPSDIYDLTRDGKFTNYGQLELVQYQSFTSVTEVFFTAIKEDIYDVHMAVCNQLEVNSSSARFGARLSNDGGSSYETSGYDFTYEGNRDDGDSLSVRTQAGGDFGYITNNQKTTRLAGAIVYFYDLGNPNKFSHCNSMSTYFDNSSDASGYVQGGGNLRNTEIHNAIRFANAGVMTGSIALYGFQGNL